MCPPLLDDSITFTDELGSDPEAVSTTPCSVEDLLSDVQTVLSEALVQQIRACFQFEISAADGQQHKYYLDLSQGDGS